MSGAGADDGGFKLDLQDLDPKPVQTAEVKKNFLGKGGFGVVYKATYKYMPVAVKVIDPKDLSKDAKEEIQKECRIMKKIHHVNVGRLFGLTLEDENACMVIELAELGSLFDILKDLDKYPDLPWAKRVKIALDIAQGVFILHSQKPPIFHRDLKSLNTLIRENWSAFIVDFGLAKAKEQTHSKITTAAGSYPWMAPELLDEDLGVSSLAIDIYAYGMILYELLTRTVPWAGVKQAQVSRKVCDKKERPEIPDEAKNPAVKGAPPAFVALMKDCWAQDPTARPKISEIVPRLQAIAKSLGADPTPPVSPGPTEKKPFQPSSPNEFLTMPGGPGGSGGSGGSGGGGGDGKDSKYDSLGDGPEGMMIQSSLATVGVVAANVRIDPKPDRAWPLPVSAQPVGICEVKDILYVCDFDKNHLKAYTLKGQIMTEGRTPILNRPWGLDYDTKSELIWVVDFAGVSTFSLRRELKQHFNLPEPQIDYCFSHNIKVDSDAPRYYLTLFGYHSIYMHDKKDGKLLKRFGSEAKSTDAKEFNAPMGMTIDGDSLFVCDCYHDKIQVLDKTTGKFQREWGKKGTKELGQLDFPASIHHSKALGVLFIGDRCSIQLWTPEGDPIQRVGGKRNGRARGEFYDIYGIWPVKNELFISDSRNHRIQVFKIGKSA